MACFLEFILYPDALILYRSEGRVHIVRMLEVRPEIKSGVILISGNIRQDFMRSRSDVIILALNNVIKFYI